MSTGLNNIASVKDMLIREFAAFEKSLNGLSQTPLHTLRKKALSELQSLSFPTTKHEEWKFTSVQPILNEEFELQISSNDSVNSIDEFLIPGLDCHLLVFVNGHYSTLHSKVETRNGRSVIHGLADSYLQHQRHIDEHITTLAESSINAFTAANTTFSCDGAYVSVEANEVIEKPIYILMIVDSQQQNILQQPRHLVTLSKNSQATFIIRSVTIGNKASLTNQVMECFADENAHADFYFIQDDKSNTSVINTTQSEIRKNAVVNFTTISLSGNILRNNLGVRLIEQHSEAHMYGLYLLDGTTHADNHTVMDHAVANCHSNELYKGILDDSSRGVFNGKIFVREGAQKTLAYQSNRNILLSKNATVNTKPQLEIFADDVKCSHGCTVGQLDDEALFYLRARGITEINARALLLTAFAEDITNQITIDSLREFVNTKIEQRLISNG